MEPQRIYMMYDREVSLHSHPAYRQDEWVINMFGGMAGGSFIEIGAYDGVEHSNTFALEDAFNWSGSLVEADPENAKLCKKNRKGVGNQVVHACVGAMSGEGRFFHDGPFSGLSLYIPKECKRRLIRNCETSHQKVVTLATLLEEIKAPRVVHYLSLGMEGAELSTLHSYFTVVPQEQQRIFQTITFTSHYPADRIGALERDLRSLGYTLEEVRGFTYCFSHKSLAD
jgi:FkbM family methyltransferase